VAFQAATVSRITVEESLGLFNIWVKSQKAQGINTAPTELKVKAAFQTWKASQLALIDAGKLNSIAISTNASGQTGLPALIDTLTSQSSQYKADLLNLLVTIGVKLPQ
jgi:hypothetical protein